jgi:hypothetical protein
MSQPLMINSGYSEICLTGLPRHFSPLCATQTPGLHVRLTPVSTQDDDQEIIGMGVAMKDLVSTSIYLSLSSDCPWGEGELRNNGSWHVGNQSKPAQKIDDTTSAVLIYSHHENSR